MKHDKGSMLVAVAFMLLTVAITISMMLDFFKLNEKAVQVIQQAESKSFLLNQLVRQAGVIAALRNSANDARNSVFRSCVLSASGGGGACHGKPSEFFLMSPILGSPTTTLAGTESQPTMYNRDGDSCLIANSDCIYKAIAYFSIFGPELRIWISLYRTTDGATPTISLNTPNVGVPVNEISKFYK